MKLKITFFALLCCFAVSIEGYSQKKKSTESAVKPSADSSAGISANSRVDILKNVLNESLRYGDLQVAKSALYEIMVLMPEEKTLKDSLAYLYFKMEAYPQCILISREILKERPGSMDILEIKAISEQSLGLVKESLDSYETLEKNSKNLYHTYQIASLQFQLKRFGECAASINRIFADPKADETKINIALSQTQEQTVPIKAALLNMRGVMAMETNDEASAKKFFEESSAISPEFVLPKANLEAINKKTQASAKPKQGK